VSRDRIALQLDRLRQPLKKSLHTAGRLSYDGVQINARSQLRPGELTETGFREIRKLLADLDLRVGSIFLPTRRGVASPEQVEGRLAAIGEAMRMASKLHSRTLLTNVGRLPSEDSKEQVQLADALNQLWTLGDRVGVELTLCSVDASERQLADLLNGFAGVAIGVDLNPAELVAAGRSPREFLAALGHRVAHVFASDAVAGVGQEGAEEVELGRGSADFPTLIGMLEEHDYRGWTTVSPRNSENHEEELADALEFLRSM
jgi:sugar phosphate isomerase/epimerase